jgi:hypothetical protein
MECKSGKYPREGPGSEAKPPPVYRGDREANSKLFIQVAPRAKHCTAEVTESQRYHEY